MRRAPRPRVLTLGVLGTALALGLAACGGDGDESPPTAAPPPPAPPAAAPQPPTGDGSGGVRLTRLGEFDAPLYVTQPPGGEGPGGEALYVVEQTGAVRVIDGGRVLDEPFLDVSEEIVSGGSEQGLLSLAFAPDYADSGRFYVHYTDTEGDTRVVEYRRSADDPLRADPDSARIVLGVDQPFSNHNGGLVLFGPDGLLYIGLGDGGSGDDPQRNGQDLSTLLGKLLRIDPRPSGASPYSVPADNPFAGEQGARPEIYAYGLRNPWRFSFDPVTGALTIGDVGQASFEEINYVPTGQGAGANFGWSAFEGDARFNEDQEAPGMARPILTYGREGGNCAVTGGYVVRDEALRSLYGRYLYADYCAGELRSFVPRPVGPRDDHPVGLEVPALTSFGEDAEGRIYATSQEGPVYRLDPR